MAGVTQPSVTMPVVLVPGIEITAGSSVPTLAPADAVPVDVQYANAATPTTSAESVASRSGIAAAARL